MNSLPAFWACAIFANPKIETAIADTARIFMGSSPPRVIFGTILAWACDDLKRPQPGFGIGRAAAMTHENDSASSPRPAARGTAAGGVCMRGGPGDFVR